MISNERLSQIQIITGESSDKRTPYTIKPSNVRDDSVPAVVFDITEEKCGKRWQENDFLIIDCMADMRATLTLNAEFFTKDEVKFFISNTLVGGRRIACCFELKYLDSSRTYPRNLPGHLKSVACGKPVSLDEIDRVRITVMNAPEFKSFYLYDVTVTDCLPNLNIDGEALVDMFGQWKCAEWKWKIKSEKELTEFLKSEYEWAKNHNRYKREDYDEYGGWTGKHFEKKGYFYRLHDGRRWWLVDPEGNAFFSNGICYGNRTGIYGVVDAMENLFEYLPAKDDPIFSCAWTTADTIPEFAKRNGVEAGKSKMMYNFARANMIRAFGADKWWNAWVTINTARMKQWGFNTISVGVNNYTDEDVTKYLRAAKIPYCITLKNFPKTEKLLFRDFPDVFSKEYENRCKIFCNQLKPFCDDPYFIGYFINNEPEWMFQKDVNVAERTLAMDEQTASKTELIHILKEKYHTVSEWNKAWNTEFEDFDKIVLTEKQISKLSETAKRDLRKMQDILREKYASVPSFYLSEIATHALNLGMRYSSVTEGDFAGSEQFDVFSFNCYSRAPENMFKTADAALEIPFMVGEWHIGSAESGLMSAALVNAVSQSERGKGCAEYLRTAFTDVNCIGVHYFELNDQPLLGRFDGENMQIGLIDVCNRPYSDCVEKIAEINQKMYEILDGTVVPEKIEWKYHYRY